MTIVSTEEVVVVLLGFPISVILSGEKSIGPASLFGMPESRILISCCKGSACL